MHRYWIPEGSPKVVADENGEWVKYSDHLAEVADRDQRIVALEQELREWRTKFATRINDTPEKADAYFAGLLRDGNRNKARAEAAEASLLALQDAQQRLIEERDRFKAECDAHAWRFCPDCGADTSGSDMLADPPRPSEKGPCPECTGVPDGAFTKGYCERCDTTKRKPLVPRPSAPQE